MQGTPEGNAAQDLRRIYTLQIILTNHCNLNCTYCYVRRDEIRSIPMETAKAAIREMAETHPPQEWRCMVAFMGGEPLAEFDKLRSLCEWMWAAYPDHDIRVHSPTNGTLITDEVRRFMTENRGRVSFGLSYDGEWAQNVNRSDSDAMINPRMFRDLWPEQLFKMTVTEESVPTLAQSIITMHENGYRLGANPACGEPPWSMENVREFGRQMLLLAEYYARHPEVTPVDMLDVDLRLVPYYREPMRPTCGIGNDYVTVDTDGGVYPCHMFSSLALTQEQKERAAAFCMGERRDFDVPACKDCILRLVCPRCYGMSFLRTGDPFAVDINMCRLFRQQVKGACSYQIKRMAQLETMTENDHLIMQGIRLILSRMQFS